MPFPPLDYEEPYNLTVLTGKRRARSHRLPKARGAIMAESMDSPIIHELKDQYRQYDWTYHPVSPEIDELMFRWPGRPEEDIVVVVHQSDECGEKFHYHDFFHFNFALKGSFESTCGSDRRLVVTNEGELCAGQPFSGHAIGPHDNNDTLIVGVLIKQSAMQELFLPLLSPNASLFRFLVDPTIDVRSDAFIHFSLGEMTEIRQLLSLMVEEYASKQEDSQSVLRGLVLSLLALVSRRFSEQGGQPVVAQDSAPDEIVQYIRTHSDSATLTEVAGHFGYAPSYLSGLIKAKSGKSFSEIVLSERMARAAMMLEGTNLSVEEVSRFLGYGNTSSFYRAWRKYYGTSPRE